MGTKSNKKLTLIPLVLMIFTSVFGFANMPRAFYLMGYGAIPWYIISALAFFIPYAFMMSEYGAAFKEEKGGIYSWMEKSVGAKYAFVGIFMWYASYVVWMVNTASSIWIPFSNAIFGTDNTATWSLFGLGATKTIGLLGSMWIIIVTIVATKGLEKIKKVTSVAGTAIALLNVILILGAITVLIANKGELAEPILSAATFTSSPNPAYQSSISIISFSVFAIFAFGGIEVVGGLVDETANPTVTFPKGLTLAAMIISIGYCLGIFMIGIFTNWNDVLSSDSVNMANVAYVVMKNLGYSLAHALGATEALALKAGVWAARFVGLSMFLALTGSFFTLTYAPLKQLIEGTPKSIWPKKVSKVKDGMPKNAMIVQCIFVVILILIVSFGGEGASEFFNKLIMMTNVAMTIPYMFVAGAFYSFKKNETIEKPFEMFKTKKSALIATTIVVCTIGFANIFTIIEPLFRGDIVSTMWYAAGPIFFSVVALLLYRRAE